MKDKSIDYSEIKKDRLPIVYVVQEIAGTREGRPKINIMGAFSDYFFSRSLNLKA